ncbi:MAG: hypothetical protein AAGK17_00030 [Pseudomonadota bacterium]
MTTRALFLAPLLIAFSAPLSASPENVAPAGWQRSERGSLVVYQSNPPGEVMMFRTFPNESDPAEQVALFTQIMTGNAQRIVRSDFSTDGPLHVQDVEYINRNVTMAGKIVAVRQSDGTVLAMAHVGEKSASGLAGRMQSATARMAALGDGSSANEPRAATAAPPASQSGAPQTAALASPEVERVLFDLKYSYGVGGAVYPTYHLVALLKNGEAARLGSYAVDAIDVASIRREKRAHVGQWRRAGSQYNVRWGDGGTSEIKTSVGPPAALPSSSALNGTYQAIGGGGNTALGGQTLTAEVKQFTFRPNGTFVQSSSKTASAPRVAAGSRSGNAGRWSLEGPNLTLTYGNGKVVRTSVFYSANRKSTAKGGRYGVIWIGGEDYRRK